MTGNYLKEKYDRALKVRVLENGTIKLNRRRSTKTLKGRNHLYYLERSADYCKRDVARGEDLNFLVIFKIFHVQVRWVLVDAYVTRLLRDAIAVTICAVDVVMIKNAKRRQFLAIASLFGVVTWRVALVTCHMTYTLVKKTQMKIELLSLNRRHRLLLGNGIAVESLIDVERAGKIADASGHEMLHHHHHRSLLAENRTYDVTKICNYIQSSIHYWTVILYSPFRTCFSLNDVISACLQRRRNLNRKVLVMWRKNDVRKKATSSDCMKLRG